MPSERPTLAWTLAVAAGLLAGVLGLVSLVYAAVLKEELLAEHLPVPEHVPWMVWFGVLTTVLGGLLAAVLLARRWSQLRQG